ncbi:MAG TPA: DUF3800 domain-containing protein [Flavobacteriales bacterium]|nr:DUF3800 domain-containing protein [Flavobacteriales bacterium]
MYTCYIDESGHCGNKYNPAQPVEVLVGVMNNLGLKLPKTQREFLQLVTKLTQRDIAVTELKASQAYRGQNAWSGIDAATRMQLFEEILNWAAERSCKYFVAPIDSKRFFERKAGGCETANRLKAPYIAGAMNIVLAIERCQSGTNNNKGKTWVVFDEQKNLDEDLKRLLLSDLAWTDPYTGYTFSKRKAYNPPRLDEIFDIPYFSPSHGSVMIQVADWVAFVVNKYLLLTVYGFPEKFEGELDQITRWYGIVGKCLVKHTAIEPPGKDSVVQFFREVRPAGWSAKEWQVAPRIAQPAVDAIAQVRIDVLTMSRTVKN